MQLCFNVHPKLAAGQEITLLMFETLKARKDALEGQFVYGGLAQTFKELWRLETEEEYKARTADWYSKNRRLWGAIVEALEGEV